MSTCVMCQRQHWPRAGKQWSKTTALCQFVHNLHCFLAPSLHLLTRPGTNHAPLIPRPRDWDSEKIKPSPLLLARVIGRVFVLVSSVTWILGPLITQGAERRADKWQLQIRHKQFTGIIHTGWVSSYGIPLMAKITQIMLLWLLAKFQSRLNCY